MRAMDEALSSVLKQLASAVEQMEATRQGQRPMRIRVTQHSWAALKSWWVACRARWKL